MFPHEFGKMLVVYEELDNVEYGINQNKESKEIGNEHSTKLVTEELHTSFSVGYLKLLCNPIILITAITCFLSCFEYWYLEPIFALRLDEMGLNNFEIGIFFWIFGTSYTISTFAVSYFTDRFDIRGILYLMLSSPSFVFTPVNLKECWSLKILFNKNYAFELNVN